MDFFIKTKTDYENFKNYIRQISKDESVECKEKHKKVVNTNKDILCVSMSEIRNIAKNINKNCAEEFLNIVQDDSYEVDMIWGIVIANLKDLDLQIKYIDIWKETIDCWALCDSVCSSMKILKKAKNKSKYFDYYKNLCFSQKEFVARFGLITLMTNYLEEECIDEILSICKNVKNTTYYVKMALAWLVSFAFIKFREKTLKLFEEKCLDKFVQNKAISKCRDSFVVSKDDKELLLKYRKNS